jgi:hypothetical protein
MADILKAAAGAAPAASTSHANADAIAKLGRKKVRESGLTFDVLTKLIAQASYDAAADVERRLSDRIAELEQRQKAMTYEGVWDATRDDYHKGCFVTSNGNIWHCNRGGTRSRPADGPDWTLACRAGRDSRK